MIVVGVNRSAEAAAALRWAVDEAKVRNTTVRAVYAWRTPLPTGRRLIPPELLTSTAMHAAARRLLDGAVDASLVDGDPDVERVVIEGPAAACLAEVADDAELLVVGTRHHHGLGSVVIGSVSAECVLRARCPVVVVHRDRPRPALTT